MRHSNLPPESADRQSQEGRKLGNSADQLVKPHLSPDPAGLVEGLGRKIRWLRAAAGMTQVELAEAIAVSEGAINAWEGGGNKPYRANVVRLARFVDVPADELVDFLAGTVPLRTIPKQMRPWLSPPGPPKLAKATIADMRKLIEEAR